MQNILIIAQCDNDLSLVYGKAQDIKTTTLIQDAIKDNPGANIFLKIHPDVLSKKRKSDIDFSDPATQELLKKVIILDKFYHPAELLRHFSKVYTKTSTLGFEAMLQGCECVCYGAPFYASWQACTDRQKIARRGKKRSIYELFAAAYIDYSRYKIGKNDSTCLAVIEEIARQKKQINEHKGRAIFLGFSLWKQQTIRQFFPKTCIEFHSTLPSNLPSDTPIFIWGKKADAAALKRHFQRVFIIEDGFIRSVSLGSDLQAGFSIICDDLGIYFDPNEPSRLEFLCNNSDFHPDLLDRAKKIRQSITQNDFSKYNNSCRSHSFAKQEAARKIGKKIILIPAQVEDDASILLGGMGFSSQKLIKTVRKNNPTAFIAYKIHPDVASGNRKGLKEREKILEFCDEIIRDASIAECIKHCDEVHTITSTAGFDALIRGKKTITYGAPFYAGWGLSVDENLPEFVKARRQKRLNIDELIAAALILYPRYLHPKTRLICSCEETLEALIEQKNRLQNPLIRSFYTLKIHSIRTLRRLWEKLSR